MEYMNLFSTDLIFCLLIIPMISVIILFGCGKGRVPGGKSTGKRSSKKHSKALKEEDDGSLKMEKSVSNIRNISSEKSTQQLDSSKKETTTTTSNSEKNISKIKKLKSKMLVAPEDQTPRRKVKKTARKDVSQEQQSEREKTKSAGALPPAISPGRGSGQQPPTKYENADKVQSTGAAAGATNNNNNNNEPSSSSAAPNQKQESDKPSPYEPLSPAGSELDVRMSDAEASKKEQERLKVVASAAAAATTSGTQQQNNDESAKGGGDKNKDDNEEEEEVDEDESHSKKEKKKSKKKSKKKKKKKDKKDKKKKKSKKSNKEKKKSEKEKKIEGQQSPALAPTQYENLNEFYVKDESKSYWCNGNRRYGL
uniref:Uncharacterized protein n=1 Tax=Panagrolaimus superbus TaxID=310955 RepID=A0A914YCD6_9BILA